MSWSDRRDCVSFLSWIFSTQLKRNVRALHVTPRKEKTLKWNFSHLPKINRISTKCNHPCSQDPAICRGNLICACRSGIGSRHAPIWKFDAITWGFCQITVIVLHEHSNYLEQARTATALSLECISSDCIRNAMVGWRDCAVGRRPLPSPNLLNSQLDGQAWSGEPSNLKLSKLNF